METRVIEQMSNQMAQLMLTKMGLGSNLITIQGTPVSQAPVKEEVEEESDLVPEDFQEKM
jgi:hypothetical protein